MIILLLKIIPEKKSARLFFVYLIFLLYMFPQAYVTTPHEVVAIKPLHSLVAGGMPSAVVLYLIVQEPYRFTLKLSTARALKNA